MWVRVIIAPFIKKYFEKTQNLKIVKNVYKVLYTTRIIIIYTSIVIENIYLILIVPVLSLLNLVRYYDSSFDSGRIIFKGIDQIHKHREKSQFKS